MKKTFLVTISVFALLSIKAQNNIGVPFPVAHGTESSFNEEGTDVFLKIRPMPEAKLIDFEYASNGAPWHLEIRDQSGMVLLKKTQSREQNLFVSSSGFSTGTYICTLYTRNSIITKKMVLE